MIQTSQTSWEIPYLKMDLNKCKSKEEAKEPKWASRYWNFSTHLFYPFSRNCFKKMKYFVEQFPQTGITILDRNRAVITSSHAGQGQSKIVTCVSWITCMW